MLPPGSHCHNETVGRPVDVHRELEIVWYGNSRVGARSTERREIVFSMSVLFVYSVS